MIRKLAALGVALALGGAAGTAHAVDDLGTLKVGVLQFGTVNWELDVIQHHGFDQANGFTLEVQGYAGDDATAVALQGGAVDAIVDDYLWVSRQRAEGEALTFVPFSSAIGALMVPGDAGIADLADLAGKKLGIVGGPLDKSWLLLQALARQRHEIDLAAVLEEPVFGAPPLLSEALISGEVDAVLTYWHYAARLEAQGYERLLDVNEAIAALGVAGQVPQLGYVFREAFAEDNDALIAAFAEASRAAKAMMLMEREWQRLQPLTKAEDEATMAALKAGFQAGIIEHWGEAERAEAAKLYAILAKLGGAPLVGRSATLSPGTFWPITY